jgi:hypothetical protein
MREGKAKREKRSEWPDSRGTNWCTNLLLYGKCWTWPMSHDGIRPIVALLCAESVLEVFFELITIILLLGVSSILTVLYSSLHQPHKVMYD